MASIEEPERPVGGVAVIEEVVVGSTEVYIMEGEAAPLIVKADGSTELDKTLEAGPIVVEAAESEELESEELESEELDENGEPSTTVPSTTVLVCKLAELDKCVDPSALILSDTILGLVM